MAHYLVIDIGGTNLRSAVFDAARGELLDVRRGAVESFLTHPHLTAAELCERLIAQLEQIALEHQARVPISGVGISFPGPVNQDGEVHSAATLWGSGAPTVPLRLRLQQRLNMPVVVMNDISAAVYRYRPRFDQDFAVITVSSGIGNKVFAAGKLLLNQRGLGGELGHHRVVTGEDALPCDCGGLGHLGAIASGRGAERLAQRWAAREPSRFAASRLFGLTAGAADRIDTRALVQAIRAGDALACDVLRFGQAHLAASIALLYNAIGVERFLFIGGFCLALGEAYVAQLRERMGEADLFGLPPQRRDAMIVLGEDDDDHSLLGLGRYFADGS
jgi:C7-cyclitol 7-kinase